MDARPAQAGSGVARTASPEQAARLKARLAFAGFFFMIGGYALLKPVRDGVFLQRLGFIRMPLFDVAVAAASLVVVTLYNLVAVRVPRRMLVLGGFSAFAGGIALCAVLLNSGAAGPAAGFYVGLNLSWLLLLAIFWSMVNDVFGVAEGRRWYGWVALAGPLSALTGSALASALVPAIGSIHLLWVSLGLFSCAWVLALALDAVGQRHPPADRPQVILPIVFPDPRLLLRSRYVLGIAGLMLLGVFAMKIYMLDFNRLLAGYAGTLDEKVRWAANRNILVNVVGVVIQLGVTPLILKRYGPRVALAILPLISLAGGAALASHEVFFVAFGVIAAAEGTAYTLNQSAKELLYVPGDRSVKYQAKALVDVFCFRFGEMLGSLTVLAGLEFMPGTFQHTYRAAVLLAAAASIAWWRCARVTGRAFDRAAPQAQG